jgi:DnaJ-class molecular chaperone
MVSERELEKFIGRAVEIRDRNVVFYGDGEKYVFEAKLLIGPEGIRPVLGVERVVTRKCKSCDGYGESRYGSHSRTCHSCNGTGVGSRD